MKRRRWVIGVAVLILVLVGARMSSALAYTRPGSGEWVTATPYRGTGAGTVGLVIRGDGRVQMVGESAPRLWWADPKYELRLRGDRVQVLSGAQVVSELWVRHRAGELRLLDPAFVQETLVLRKLDPS